MSLRPSALVLLLASLVPGVPSGAADQALQGAQLAVTNPDPADPARRKLSFSARDREGAHTLSGDPSVPAVSGGAVLHVSLEGATPSAQTFVLPQGTTAAGKPLWSALGGDGFRYADPRGERGPVKSLRVRRAGNGSFSLEAKLDGKGGALDLVPPDAGTGAFVTLTLGGGDRYCVRFGDGRLRDGGARAFRVKKPLTEGCPPLVSGEFLALTYNVAGLPEGLSGSDPEINTPLIAPLLNGYDLVLLQETWKTPDPNPLARCASTTRSSRRARSHPFKSLSAPLPLGRPIRAGRARCVADGLNHVLALPLRARSARVPWARLRDSAADCLALKGFSVARTTFAPGVSVDVYDLHMEAGGEPEDDALRDEGVTQLATFIESYSAGQPVIVGGDFNLHTDDEPDATQFQRLLARGGPHGRVRRPRLSRARAHRQVRLPQQRARSTLVPLSWHFETDVFVRDGDVPLSDHEALAVRFSWSVTGE